MNLGQRTICYFNNRTGLVGLIYYQLIYHLYDGICSSITHDFTLDIWGNIKSLLETKDKSVIVVSYKRWEWTNCNLSKHSASTRHYFTPSWSRMVINNWLHSNICPLLSSTVPAGINGHPMILIGIKLRSERTMEDIILVYRDNTHVLTLSNYSGLYHKYKLLAVKYCFWG